MDAHGARPTGQATHRMPDRMPDRDSERLALLRFGRGCMTQLGTGYMDNEGVPIQSEGCHLWMQGRFVHVFATEAVCRNSGLVDDGRGGATVCEDAPTLEECRNLAAWGVACLANNFRDADHGGWFSRIAAQAGDNARAVALSERKEAYAHAFVILAGASAAMAGIEGGPQLLEEALDVFDRYFWDATARMVRESYANDWSDLENYRGINANMHSVEAFLAAWDATGNVEYLRRAADISLFVCRHASETAWRIHEHYTGQWHVDDSYNRDRPADQFRPWGATVGHGFEWSRLVWQTALAISALSGEQQEAFAALSADGQGQAPSVLVEQTIAQLVRAGYALYATARRDGWDGKLGGFCYTTDFDGHPIVRSRMHWVMCEAVNAAHVARTVRRQLPLGSDGPEDPACQPLSDERYNADWQAWWDFIGQNVLEGPGRWRHELDEFNQPACATWDGKPDIYHAYQALVIEHIDCSRSFAAQG